MNEIKFKANTIHAEKNNIEEYFMVGLADDKFNYQNYIIFQKAFKFDEDDIACGMDGHYFEINDQSNSGYKCCKRVILTNEHLEIFLEPGVISELDKIQVDISEIQLSRKFTDYIKIILGEALEVDIRSPADL